MNVNFAPFEGEKKVQIRAILVPESIHKQIQAEATAQMRNITAQTVAILVNHYATKQATKQK